MKFPLFLLLAALSLAAQPAAPKAAPRPAGVPANATEVDPDTWRLTGKDGKTWMIRRTPFGIMRNLEQKDSPTAKRSEPMPASDRDRAPNGVKLAGAGPDVLELINVVEKGQDLVFTKPGPFGVYTWTRKKTQLNEDETIVWDRARAKAAIAAKKD